MVSNSLGDNRSLAVEIQPFQQTVWRYYDAHGRYELPWRRPGADGTFNAYHILVSELMLQQTQVSRVIPKFRAFIQKFQTVEQLAAAPLSGVLTEWSGLGYNRRAKFLWQAAQRIAQHFYGQIPRTKNELMSLPGIGENTAGAILVYAYNQPALFIETNVRTVFFHHFFQDKTAISDKILAPLVQQSLPPDNPREWYWALMDYGTHLKQTVGNLSRASAHYTKQSAFQGSRRQIRGQILRLLAKAPQPFSILYETITDERLESVLADLIREGFIEKSDSRYYLRA